MLSSPQLPRLEFHKADWSNGLGTARDSFSICAREALGANLIFFKFSELEYAYLVAKNEYS